MPDRTPLEWDRYWAAQRRRKDRYWENHTCQHDWQKQPKDFFQWYCLTCGAWSRRSTPFKRSQQKGVERPDDGRIMPKLKS